MVPMTEIGSPCKIGIGPRELGSKSAYVIYERRNSQSSTTIVDPVAFFDDLIELLPPINPLIRQQSLTPDRTPLACLILNSICLVHTV